MAVGFQLVNLDKKETIGFAHVDTGDSLWELSGTVVFGSLLSYYMLKNIGDRITFINDHDGEFYLFGGHYTWDDFHSYRNVTDTLITELIEAKIYEDRGVNWIDQAENLYYRNLINVFDPKCGHSGD